MKNTGVIAGNFDVIHPGYIHVFNKCKEFCTELIILLHELSNFIFVESLKILLSTSLHRIGGSTLLEIFKTILFII